MKWLQFLWRCCKGSWTVSGPDLRNACVETEAILRPLLSKHKFSNWHKTKWLFIFFSFMTNKQIKNSCVDFFYVLKFSRFIAQPCIFSKFCLSRSQWPRVLRLGSAACWTFGFEYHRFLSVCLSVVFIVCCQAASGWSLVNRSPNECDVSKYDPEASTVRTPWPTGVCLAMHKNYLNTDYPQVSSPKTVWSSFWFQYKATSFNL